MDLLGGFDFGRLIRMFLPGIVVFVGLIFAADAIHELIRSTETPSHAVLQLVKEYQTIFLAASIPSSLICGLLVNSVMFVTNITRLAGNTAERRKLSITMIEELVAHCDKQGIATRLLEITPDWAKEKLSLESFLLPILTPDRILYLKGHFYYYLQFDIAFALSVLILEASGITWMIVYWNEPKSHGYTFVWILIISIVVCGALVTLLYKSAQRNYHGNLRADLSLYLGALCLTNCFPPNVQQ